MGFPDFIPMIAKEKKKRELTAFFIEFFVWCYFLIFLGKIFFTSLLFPFLENFARSKNIVFILYFFKNINYESRYFEFPVKYLIILIFLGVVSGFFVALSGRGFGHWIASFSKLQPKTPEDSLKIQSYWKFARLEAIILVVMTVVTGVIVTETSFTKIFQSEGLLGAGRLSLQLVCGVPGVGHHFSFGSLYDLFQWFLNVPIRFSNLISNHKIELLNVTCIPNDFSYFYTALGKLVESIYLAFMATFFSAPVAFILSFLASRNLTRHSFIMRTIYFLIRSYMNITRSIEPLIWAILFSVWIGIGPFAGSLALFIHSVSSLVKQYSEAVEGIDDGPIEAIQATGASRTAIVWYAVVPQVILPYLAFTIYRWDINVRMATIIGLVGGGGIGSILIQEQMLARWTQVGSLAFLIFLVVWIMDFLSARIREAIQ